MIKGLIVRASNDIGTTERIFQNNQTVLINRNPDFKKLILISMRLNYNLKLLFSFTGKKL